MRENKLIQKIEPHRFARTGLQMEGDVPVSALKRLGEMLATTTGQVRAHFHFFMGEDALPLVSVRCSVNLSLKCQRCLGVYDELVSLEYTLAIVGHESQAQSLSSQYEPFILNSEFITPGEIIEDELILNVPVVPKHDDQNPNCIVLTVAKDTKNNKVNVNPFEILKDLNVGKA